MDRELRLNESSPNEGARLLSSAMRERWLIVAALFAFFLGGYLLIGYGLDPPAARSLETELDHRIPFVPGSIFVYAFVYLAAAFPAFVVRSPLLFRRVALSYALVISFGFLCFVLFPVTSSELRAHLGAPADDDFALWGVRLLYVLDPPMNLFPSLHLAVATLAALAAWKAGGIYAGLPFLMVAAIAVSICTVKQHFWIDGVAGVALAIAAYVLILRPIDVRDVPRDELAYSWGGPAVYLALVGAIYFGCYVLYRAGFNPAAL